MKFLFGLFKYFPYGGLQKDALRFAEEACRRGHETVFLTTAWEGPPPPAGISLKFCPRKGWSNHRRMDNFARAFQQEIASGQYDASLALNRLPGADFYFVADRCTSVLMHAKHSALALALLPRYRLFLQHEAQICAPDSQTRLLYIAPAQRQEYQQTYQMPAERLLYLPPGMDQRCCRPPEPQAAAIRRLKRQELGLPTDTLALIQVGNSLSGKGMDRTLRALASARRSARRLQLFLVGNVPADNLRTLARHLDILPCVTCLGPRDDIPELLLACDLMVHPAREEGAGSVIIEAIASGLPVICTAACGFAPFAQEATATVVPEPFRQDELDSLLQQTLDRLPELASRTLEYARTQDFCSRSARTVDYLEQAGTARRQGRAGDCP